jgi:hypothetical protein
MHSTAIPTELAAIPKPARRLIFSFYFMSLPCYYGLESKLCFFLLSFYNN